MLKVLKFTAIFLVSILLFNGCYNDKEEVLYRFSQLNCDVSNVTYSQTIAPIMQTNCNSCHNSATASGGWITDNYTSLKTIATNGKLYGAVSHASGYIFMPQNGTKLSDCDIAKIKKWIDSNTPNN